MSDPARELQAVLGRRKPAQRVAARDFGRPRRMSPERSRALRIALEKHLPVVEKQLLQGSGLRLGLKLGRLDEVDAGRLFDGSGEPLCVLRFQCQKAPAWLTWDPATAVSAVESLFGARHSAPAARRLSPTETKITSQFLAEIARSIAAVVAVPMADPVLVQLASELGNWREAGPEAESHRLEIELEARLGETTSQIRIYLPGVELGEDRAGLVVPATLPAHLEHVEVELSACLSGCELSLDQLLALEEGDVIPLEARLGDPTTLSVEGLTLAHARLGSHRGRLAVRIERLRVQAETAA